MIAQSRLFLPRNADHICPDVVISKPVDLGKFARGFFDLIEAICSVFSQILNEIVWLVPEIFCLVQGHFHQDDRRRFLLEKLSGSLKKAKFGTFDIDLYEINVADTVLFQIGIKGNNAALEWNGIVAALR